MCRVLLLRPADAPRYTAPIPGRAAAIRRVDRATSEPVERHDVPPPLAKKRILPELDVRIYDVCKPQRAKQVLDQQMLVSAALPCAIRVFADGGKTRIAFLRLTVMLGLSELERASTATEVGRTIEEISSTRPSAEPCASAP